MRISEASWHISSWCELWDIKFQAWTTNKYSLLLTSFRLNTLAFLLEFSYYWRSLVVIIIDVRISFWTFCCQLELAVLAYEQQGFNDKSPRPIKVILPWTEVVYCGTQHVLMTCFDYLQLLQKVIQRATWGELYLHPRVTPALSTSVATKQNLASDKRTE